MYASAIALLAATAAYAIPLSPGKYDTLAMLEKRLVINPQITSPTADTVWQAGQEVTVTWSTALLEEYPETADYKGDLLLGYMEDDDISENLDSTPLASGFPLKDGQVSVTLPADTPARDGNAIVVLMGDSGNASPKFTIKSASSDSTAPGQLAGQVSGVASATPSQSA